MDAWTLSRENLYIIVKKIVFETLNQQIKGRDLTYLLYGGMSTLKSETIFSFSAAYKINGYICLSTHTEFYVIQ